MTDIRDVWAAIPAGSLSKALPDFEGDTQAVTQHDEVEERLAEIARDADIMSNCEPVGPLDVKWLVHLARTLRADNAAMREVVEAARATLHCPETGPLEGDHERRIVALVDALARLEEVRDE